MIKSKPSVKENRDDYDIETPTALDEDAELFIEYMINKSTRLRELVEKKDIYNETKFF